jgi:YHS domain-containing protein
MSSVASRPFITGIFTSITTRSGRHSSAFRTAADERAAQPAQEYTAQYGDQTFYFWSEDCRQVFEESPAQYAQVSVGTNLRIGL